MQLLQHIPTFRRFGTERDPIHLDVTPNQFLLHDIDQEIRYITPGGKIVDKIGTMIVPVKYYTIIYANVTYEYGTTLDIAGNMEICNGWDFWKLTPDGNLELSITGHCSRPGVIIHKTESMDKSGRRVNEWMTINAFENEGSRGGVRYDKKSRREVPCKGWVNDPEKIGYVIEIRNPGDTFGYSVLDEIGDDAQ